MLFLRTRAHLSWCHRCSLGAQFVQINQLGAVCLARNFPKIWCPEPYLRMPRECRECHILHSVPQSAFKHSLEVSYCIILSMRAPYLNSASTKWESDHCIHSRSCRGTFIQHFHTPEAHEQFVRSRLYFKFLFTLQTIYNCFVRSRLISLLSILALDNEKILQWPQILEPI